MATSPNPVSPDQTKPQKPSGALLTDLHANELVFAVVGPVGSGTSEISTQALQALAKKSYDIEIIKASTIITHWAAQKGHSVPNSPKIDETTTLQDLGDTMRERAGDNAIIARHFIAEIRRIRAKGIGIELEPGKAIEPSGERRAFILDSIRHPDEIAILRRLYQDAFCLIGVVCATEERYRRLHEEKYLQKAGREDIESLMARDENAPEKHGQKVSDAFHLSDFFIDNSQPRMVNSGNKKKENPLWDVSDQISRLLDVLTQERLVRPLPHEVGMFHAYGARMRSSCLSRQVGAALMDGDGNIVATGTNEVPRAGGGVYGGGFPNGTYIIDDGRDHRCFSENKHCSNTREQNKIIEELFLEIDELKGILLTDSLKRKIRKTRIGQIIEFSRAIHAEMDALISAGRQGAEIKGTRLYVTTFPCHNCARHLVSAGVDEVQFIEPYLKSKALSLHEDAITTDWVGWVAPSIIEKTKENTAIESKVLFRPFVGVAPRLYRRAFYKDRNLKDDLTGEMLDRFEDPVGHASQNALRVGYAQAEAILSDFSNE